MTLKELSAEYRSAAELIKRRVEELRPVLRDGGLCEMEKYRLRGRINALASMYRETRATAVFLERYYEGGK